MIKLFVYGTLKRGHRNHRLLRNSTYLGNATTARRYSVIDVGFPVLILDPEGNRVRGELYEVDRETTISLDRLEGVGRMYNRVRKYVHTDDKAIIRVHYYEGIKNHWLPRHEGQYLPAPVGGVLNWRPMP